jgi:hypothetical protein
LAFSQYWLSSFCKAWCWKVQLQLTRPCPLKKTYGVKTFVVRRRGIGVNPIALHEEMSHWLMSQSGATGDPWLE